MTTRRRRNHRRGMLAEFLALIYLTTKAYRLVGWRVKTPVGEIDLILRRGKTLVFVEVKGRASHDDAAQALHPQNQSRVVRAAQYFLAGHLNYATYDMRFDALLIAWYRWPRHIPHAFS